MYYKVIDKNKSRKNLIGSPTMRIISYLRHNEGLQFNAKSQSDALHVITDHVIDKLKLNKNKHGLISYIIDDHFSIVENNIPERAGVLSEFNQLYNELLSGLVLHPA